jgi:hypothetical protein
MLTQYGMSASIGALSWPDFPRAESGYVTSLPAACCLLSPPAISRVDVPLPYPFLPRSWSARAACPLALASRDGHT